MTSSATSTYARTQTATHLSDVILGSIIDILGTIGIDPTRLFATWDTDQRAIAAWINEGSLASVALECHQPNGIVDPIVEFPVRYTTAGEGDRAFTADRASLATYLAKMKHVQRGTTHRLFCTYNGWHSAQPGWGPAARADTSGMRAYSFGTLASAPHAATGLRYYTT